MISHSQNYHDKLSNTQIILTCQSSQPLCHCSGIDGLMRARSFVQHCRHRARVAIVGIKPREHQSRHPHLGPTRIPPPPRLFWLLGALVTAPAAFLRRRGMLQPWENTSHPAPVPPALRSGSTRSLARSPPPRLFWLPGMLVVAPTSSCTAGGCCNRGKQLPVRLPSLPPLFCTLGMLQPWENTSHPAPVPPTLRSGSTRLLACSLPPSSAILVARDARSRPHRFFHCRGMLQPWETTSRPVPIPPTAFLHPRGMPQPWETTSHLVPIPSALRSSTRSLAPPLLGYSGCQQATRFAPAAFGPTRGCCQCGKPFPVWFASFLPSDRRSPARSFSPSFLPPSTTCCVCLHY